MREILFRGKRVDNGEWVNGYYAKCRGRHYILPLCNEKGYDERYEDFIEVIQETVGQYTGFTDKNGKNIFEGDIVKWSGNKETYICHWKDASFKIEDRMGNTVKTTQEAIDYLCLEVIGNIHDNPELLEEVEK